MRITLKLFGPQAKSLGSQSLELDAGPAPTCASLRTIIASQAPALAPSLPASRFALNHEFADDSTTIQPNDEVALIGPVSGG